MDASTQANRPPGKAEFHAAIARRSASWYAACLRITHNPQQAEDALQDALLSAWNKRGQFESSARLETWIHRIAVNAALQVLRRSHPERFEPLEAELPDDREQPQAQLLEAELSTNLLSSLRQLTEMERVCFVLKHLEQWRLAEIAVELDTNTGVIKQALFRGVKKLRVSMAHLRS